MEANETFYSGHNNFQTFVCSLNGSELRKLSQSVIHASQSILIWKNRTDLTFRGRRFNCRMTQTRKTKKGKKL